jgi:hypothetical protein
MGGKRNKMQSRLRVRTARATDSKGIGSHVTVTIASRKTAEEK